MEIKYPRRILIVGAPDSGAVEVVKDLTGSIPSIHENGSTAGLTHQWSVETAYYSAEVPVWMDEITDANAWKTEFLKPEAREVVDAVGALIYCFRKPDSAESTRDVESALQAIQDVWEEHIGYGGEAVMLAVAVPRTKGLVSLTDTDLGIWEDMCLQYNFEYIDYAAHGLNEFSEKTGLARLKEALETTEWAMAADDDEALDMDTLDFSEDDSVDGATLDEAEMTAELFGMKAALVGDDLDAEADEFAPEAQQEAQVESLNRMMGKLLAVKEQSADLPEAQKKRMAAQAVRDLMKDAAL